MRILEFGTDQDKSILMIHGACMSWKMMEEAISSLAQDYRVLVPVLPGYDEENLGNFTSVEAVTEEIEVQLKKENGKLELIYGMSLGGSIATSLITRGKLKAKHGLLDGGIAPYDYGKVIKTIIGVKNFLQGKIYQGFAKSGKLEKSTWLKDQPAEKVQALVQALSSMSNKTFYRSFYSANDYALGSCSGDELPLMHYWYGSREKQARKKDIKWMKVRFPQMKFREVEGWGHGEFMVLDGGAWAREVKNLLT